MEDWQILHIDALGDFSLLIHCGWFGLFVHPFSHTCNTGHVNYRLQFIYYTTTYNIWTSIKYNIINNNTKFKVCKCYIGLNYSSKLQEC